MDKIDRVGIGWKYIKYKFEILKVASGCKNIVIRNQSVCQRPNIFTFLK